MTGALFGVLVYLEVEYPKTDPKVQAVFNDYSEKVSTNKQTRKDLLDHVDAYFSGRITLEEFNATGKTKNQLYKDAGTIKNEYKVKWNEAKADAMFLQFGSFHDFIATSNIRYIIFIMCIPYWFWAIREKKKLLKYAKYFFSISITAIATFNLYWVFVPRNDLEYQEYVMLGLGVGVLTAIAGLFLAFHLSKWLDALAERNRVIQSLMQFAGNQVKKKYVHISDQSQYNDDLFEAMRKGVDKSKLQKIQPKDSKSIKKEKVEQE